MWTIVAGRGEAGWKIQHEHAILHRVAGIAPVPRPSHPTPPMPTAEDKRTSFEREALPHIDTVYRVALRLAGDVSRAEDLVQDTMLKAFRSWH